LRLLSVFRVLTERFQAGFNHQRRLDYYMNYYSNPFEGSSDPWSRVHVAGMWSRDWGSGASTKAVLRFGPQ
jgi:hypothetical protein